MQETLITTEDGQRVRQAIFQAGNTEALQRAMDADLRPGELLIRRRQVSHEELRGLNRHERRAEAARLKKLGFTRPGTYVISPDGRRFQLLPGEGLDNQGRPVVALQRVDRKFREQKLTWRQASEVEKWKRVEIHA